MEIFQLLDQENFLYNGQAKRKMYGAYNTNGLITVDNTGYDYPRLFKDIPKESIIIRDQQGLNALDGRDPNISANTIVGNLNNIIFAGGVDTVPRQSAGINMSFDNYMFPSQVEEPVHNLGDIVYNRNTQRLFLNNTARSIQQNILGLYYEYGVDYNGDIYPTGGRVVVPRQEIIDLFDHTFNGITLNKLAYDPRSDRYYARVSTVDTTVEPRIDRIFILRFKITDDNIFEYDTMVETTMPVGFTFTMAAYPEINKFYANILQPGADRVIRYDLNENGDITPDGYTMDLPAGISFFTGMSVNPITQKMYISDNGSDRLHRFSVASNGDLTYDNVSLDVSGQTTLVRGCAVVAEINKLYLAANNPMEIFRYSLTI